MEQNQGSLLKYELCFLPSRVRSFADFLHTKHIDISYCPKVIIAHLALALQRKEVGGGALQYIVLSFGRLMRQICNLKIRMKFRAKCTVRTKKICGTGAGKC